MMRFARRATLLVAFYLLASAATATAECAWVFWMQTIAPTASWDLMGAHPTHSTCSQELVDYGGLMKADGYVISGDPQSGSRMVTARKGTERVVLHCLPDTVDPRAPKGK